MDGEYRTGNCYEVLQRLELNFLSGVISAIMKQSRANDGHEDKGNNYDFIKVNAPKITITISDSTSEPVLIESKIARVGSL